ncbi:hypothetical protein E4T66_03485 [Sinimarinibacterium sp. CAU 1509]|uniref:hypothetical protein n=1 Tax=Sinimarinibacterium sp. CAU 1509 TaxID=2562283 RepID=UPI0010ABB9DE|nr:hypothetical protein [Sinimarinibacterium sp. CAU 1509]TJY62796.1 hypothetical protein E4T66_03485 [Sinimarinibacterium sp. CAU 1509]
MSADADSALQTQSHDLQQRLFVQRRLIAAQLRPGSNGNGGFPRSVTMRLLLRHPRVATRLFGELLKLLRGR